jgi:hypothetical protein
VPGCARCDHDQFCPAPDVPGQLLMDENRHPVARDLRTAHCGPPSPAPYQPLGPRWTRGRLVFWSARSRRKLRLTPAAAGTSQRAALPGCMACRDPAPPSVRSTTSSLRRPGYDRRVVPARARAPMVPLQRCMRLRMLRGAAISTPRTRAAWACRCRPMECMGPVWTGGFRSSLPPHSPQAGGGEGRRRRPCPRRGIWWRPRAWRAVAMLPGKPVALPAGERQRAAVHQPPGGRSDHPARQVGWLWAPSRCTRPAEAAAFAQDDSDV